MLPSVERQRHCIYCRTRRPVVRKLVLEEAVTKAVCDCGKCRTVEGTSENGVGVLELCAYFGFIGAEELSVSHDWSVIRGGGKDGWRDSCWWVVGFRGLSLLSCQGRGEESEHK